MGKSNDIRGAVIDDLTFDPDVEREAAEVMVAELTGVRRVRNDVQIRDLEQP